MTIKQAEALIDKIMAECGIKPTIHDSNETSSLPQTSTLHFKKDLIKAEDQKVREEVILEIMQNRGVSREEAEEILSNPM